MKRKNLTILLVCGLLSLVLITGVLANTVETHLPWHVIGGGGGTVQSGDRQIQHTIGQAITGSTRGNSYQMGSGYWTGIVREVPPPRESHVYLPMINSTTN